LKPLRALNLNAAPTGEPFKFASDRALQLTGEEMKRQDCHNRCSSKAFSNFELMFAMCSELNVLLPQHLSLRGIENAKHEVSEMLRVVTAIEEDPTLALLNRMHKLLNYVQDKDRS
jgi:hypothetical protein